MLAIAYAAAAALSLALSRRGNDIAGLWLPNAVAFVLMARLPGLDGVAGYACVFAASLAINLLGGSTPDAALLFSLANVVHAGLCLRLGAACLRRTEGPTLRGFAAMLLLTAGPASAAAALLAAATAWLARGWPLLDTAWTAYSSIALGLALLLPPAAYANSAALARLRRPRHALWLGASLVGAAGFAALSLMWSAFPVALAILPLLLVAPRLAPFELGLVCAATGGTMVAIAVGGLAPGVDGGVGAFSGGSQLAVAITVVMPFLGGLLLSQLEDDKRRIAEGEQRFRRAMDDSAIGVAIVGLDGRIAEANPAFASMLGYSRSELQAMTFQELTHPDDRPLGADTMRRVRAGEAESFRFEKRYLRKDGSPVWALLSGSVIRDGESGAPLYMVSQIEDIDARKQAEARVAEAETRWNFALASAGQGVWDIDLKNGCIYYSPTWKSILGYADDELESSPDLWLKLVHPDDRDRVAAADHAHYAGSTPFFEAEFRMRHKDGRWVWILDRGKVLERDESGRAVRAIGTHTDISKLKEAEERLAHSAALLAEEKERLRVTLHSIGDAVICTDGARRVTFMNGVAEKLTGVGEAAALGAGLERVYAPVDEDTGSRLDPLAGDHSGGSHNSRAVLVRPDGSRCSIREVVSPIRSGGGELIGHVITFQDFTDARTLQRELAYAASHDPLTGLANRASFMRRIAAALAAEDGSENQFLFIDLDRFKAVNDTSGHAAGDALLRRVAETIRGHVGRDDLVARLGGDEFAILLADCTPARALSLGQGLVAAVEELDFSWSGAAHRIGASIGMTSIGADDDAVDDIIARADAACYAAKASGRGCVAAFSAEARNGTPVRALAS